MCRAKKGQLKSGTVHNTENNAESNFCLHANYLNKIYLNQISGSETENYLFGLPSLNHAAMTSHP